MFNSQQYWILCILEILSVWCLCFLSAGSAWLWPFVYAGFSCEWSKGGDSLDFTVWCSAWSVTWHEPSDTWAHPPSGQRHHLQTLGKRLTLTDIFFRLLNTDISAFIVAIQMLWISLLPSFRVLVLCPSGWKKSNLCSLALHSSVWFPKSLSFWSETLL